MRLIKYLLKLFLVLFVFFHSFAPLSTSTAATNGFIALVSAKQLKNYDFDITTSLIGRVKPAPDFVLDYLEDMDKRDNYSAYIPSGEDIRLVKKYVQILPALHRKVLKERLVGIYFVDNYLWSGSIDYVLDDQNEIYTIMILNPAILRNDISEWLTDREKSCFISNNPEITIKINCGKKYKGLLFVLLHETTHIVDYIMNWTPYFDKELSRIKGFKIQDTDFVKNVWKEPVEPVKAYNYPLRKNVTFYGFDGGPKINMTDALKVYREFSTTPFVSIYGSQNWLEDFADFVSFYHLTKVLNQPYEIKYFKNGKPIYIYTPMQSQLIKNRFSTIQSIYQSKN